jgi:hypothetical protein
MLKWVQRMAWTASLAACVLLASAASAAWAGVVFEENLWVANHDQPQTARSLIYAEQGKLRVEGSDGSVSIILPDQGYFIRPQEHSCRKVTRREQQAELAAPGAGPPAIHAHVQYTPTDATDSVDGYTCHMWTYRGGGFQRGDLCVVPASTSDSLRDLLAAFHTMSRLLDRGTPPDSKVPGKLLWWRSDSIDQLDGMPIRMRLYVPQVRAHTEQHEQMVASEITYRLVAVGDQPERLFQPPQGYDCQSNASP